MDIHPEDVLISLINITVLFILLRLILWKHVIRFLAERKNRVQSEMDNAEKHRNEAETLRNEYSEKLGGIEEQRQEILRESRQKAGEESDKILKETHERAKDMLDDAEARITAEKEQALEEAQLDITSLATEMASRILEREISEQDNAGVVDEFFRK